MIRHPSHRELQVWQRSMALSLAVYRLTESFPAAEQFALRSQIRRAAVSIPANIAEGHGRRSDGAFARHLDIALGSLAELDTLMRLAVALEYIREDDFHPLADEMEQIRRMIFALYHKVRTAARTKS